MARYLVVAHQTVTNPELLKQVRIVKEKDEQAEFVLLVPATPVRHLLFLKGDERDAQAAAEKLAAKARVVFARHGVDLRDAKVGAESPVAAIEEEVAADPNYAGFIISTLPPGEVAVVAHGPAADRGVEIRKPVYHVLAAPEWSPG